MGRFFLFREVSPGETSPVTWGLKRQKIQGQVLEFPPHRLPPMSDSSANKSSVCPIENTCPEQDNSNTIYIFASYNSKG
jgi:hypothetical protein